MNRGSNDSRNTANGIGESRGTGREEERARDEEREWRAEREPREWRRVERYEGAQRSRLGAMSDEEREQRARWEQYERDRDFARREREWASHGPYGGAVPPEDRRDEYTWRGRDEGRDFWGRERHRTLGERIGEIFGSPPERLEDRWARDTRRFRQQQGPQGESRLWNRVKGAFGGRGPKNYVRSDERIREDVCERLCYHPYVDASDVEVTVRDGEVTLTGSADDRDAKRYIGDVAYDVRGVRDVHNQLRIKSESGPDWGGGGGGAGGLGGDRR